MTDHKAEARLVLLAKAGDRDALESLLRGVQGNLLRYISGLVGASAAEDVLQDVFLGIWRNLKWLRDPELFRPWAWRIASRACFKLLKRERGWSNQNRETVSAEQLPARPEPLTPELFSGMSGVLEQLSPASRAVLLLHYAQDLSIEETAAILDINVGTAKSRLAYGLTCLRKSMERK
jgi:RNA polymerase sigma-70 factor, ECF subfamily